MDSGVRRYIKRETALLFESGNEGSDLASTMSEILADRDLYTFMAAFSGVGEGLVLGQTSLWDDIRVYITYGVVFDTQTTPRRLVMFNYDSIHFTEPIRPNIVVPMSEGEGSLTERLHLHLTPWEYKRQGLYFGGYGRPEEVVSILNQALRDRPHNTLTLDLEKAERHY